MIKHQHHEFSSDIFLILETCGAELHIRKLILLAILLQCVYEFYVSCI